MHGRGPFAVLAMCSHPATKYSGDVPAQARATWNEVGLLPLKEAHLYVTLLSKKQSWRTSYLVLFFLLVAGVVVDGLLVCWCVGVFCSWVLFVGCCSLGFGVLCVG